MFFWPVSRSGDVSGVRKSAVVFLRGVENRELFGGDLCIAGLCCRVSGQC